MNIAALKIGTPVGVLYATFPDDSEACELKGLSATAISYFESKLHQMCRQHGYPIELEHIEPEDFEQYCSRPDLGISIEVDFPRDELDVILA